MKRFMLLVWLLFLVQVPAFAQDEFKEWGQEDSAAPVGKPPGVQGRPGDAPSSPAAMQREGAPTPEKNNIYWLAGVALFTVAAGVLVRSKTGRYARPFFLVASVAILGFYRGSCPCPVGGFQEAVLFVMGAGDRAGWLWWFVVLLPLTYLLGRVWCGWVCHLGGLQELLYRPGRFNLLASAKAQRVMRYIRIGVLVALVVQLGLTHHLWWKQVDPFKTVFNLMAANPWNWMFVGVLLVSSVLVFRPFCKTLCPVGLVLGWVSKLPGAAGIATKADCIGCKSCSQACSIHALTWEQKTVVLDRQECIACGQCLDACPLHGLHVAPHKNPGIQVLHEGTKNAGALGQ